MKKTGKKILCVLLCLVLLTGCGSGGSKKEKPTATPEPTKEQQATPTLTPSVDLNSEEALKEQARFDEYLDGVFKEFMANQDSFTIHFLLEHPEKYGIDQGCTLGDINEDTEDYADRCKRLQTELLTFDYSLLTESQKVNYDRMAYEYKIGIQGDELEVCYSGLFSMNSNIISNSSTYYTEFMVCEKKDADDYIELLKLYPDLLKEALEQADTDKEDGNLPTKGMLENVIEAAEGLTDASKHPFVIAFRENMKELTDLTVAEAEDYVSRAQQVVSEQIVPALGEFMDALEKRIADKEYVEPAGLCDKKGGKEYYEYLIQAKAGSEMSAQEIYDYLDTKKKDMLKKYMAMLMLDGSVGDRYEASASQDLGDPEKILNDLKKEIKDKFPNINETKFTVSYLPKVLEIKGVLAYYLSPQIDNTGRKIIRVNGSAVGDNSVSLYSTLAHEGYPGHLYQDEYFMSSEGYHEINAMLTYLGYQEGWATMVGSKAYGWACNDDHVAMLYNFDYDYSMILAAMSDIGVNYLGWDEDAVYQFLADNLIDSKEAAKSFFEMAASDPGVYLPYTFGYHMTNDALDKLEKKGMSEMDALAAFLNVGPCSFEVLNKHLGLE